MILLVHEDARTNVELQQSLPVESPDRGARSEEESVLSISQRCSDLL